MTEGEIVKLTVCRLKGHHLIRGGEEWKETFCITCLLHRPILVPGKIFIKNPIINMNGFVKQSFHSNCRCVGDVTA